MRHTATSSIAMALFSLVWLNEISARKIIVKNSCGMKVYAAHAANNNAGSKVDGQSGVYGWEIPNDGSSTLDVPEDWDSGRIWIRSGGDGCVEDVTKCLLGKCPGGGLACEAEPNYGVAPGVTLAELSLNKFSGLDFYDVSMVEGFTVPVTITPSDSSCTTPSCGIDADPIKNCDARLALPIGTDKFWSCGNPCTAKVQFTELGGSEFQGDQISPSCCGGSWRDGRCTHDVIPFYEDLKKLCKMGYVYAKDDLEFGGKQTAVWTCPAATKPSYTVEFCAGGVNTGLLDPPLVRNGKPMNSGTQGPLNVREGGGDGIPGPSDTVPPPLHPSSKAAPAPGPSISIGGGMTTSVAVVPPISSVAPLPPISSEVVIPGPISVTTTSTAIVGPSQTSKGGWGGRRPWAVGMQVGTETNVAASPSCARKRRKRGHKVHQA